MSEGRRQIIVQPRFMDRLFAIQEYIGREDPARGRACVAALFDFIYDIIDSQPLAFPAYALRQQPALQLRRAVFRRRHIVLYEVTETEIIMLTIFPASSNPAAGDL